MDDWRVWGEEDWQAWEEENFWNAIEVDDSEYGGYLDSEVISTKKQRNDDVGKQPRVRVQKVWIPRMGHALVVGESVKAHFRARQGHMSRRIENAVVVSIPSSATVQLNFSKNGMQNIPTSWVIVPKSMAHAMSKAVHPERWRNAARRRLQMGQRQAAAPEETTCHVFG
jgi:hypothetical protein